MHLLSAEHRSEFTAVPCLVRATLAEGAAGKEPTLLVKASTLMLKYIMRLPSVQLFATLTPSGGCLYGLKIPDDPEHPMCIWSVANTKDELRTLRAMAAGLPSYIFLFNEAVASVAWTELRIKGNTATLNCVARMATVLDSDHSDEVRPAIDVLLSSPSEDTFFSSPLAGLKWTATQSYYITNRAQVSRISLIDTNEGGQQEDLCHCLFRRI